MQPFFFRTVLAYVALALLGIAGMTAFVYYPEIRMRLKPEASFAFEQGTRFLDAGSNTEEYDIDRADRFFRSAASIDPKYPYLYHQLARISFLKGDFSKALAQINRQIAEYGDQTPNSYYVRGLIEGYMGDYEASIADYQEYLKSDPHNWAAINDYAWVLLKAERAEEVVAVTDDGLKYFPDNAWLLNTNAIALYEVGDIERAREQAKKALVAASQVSEQAWLSAYPGNDPRIAQEGISAFVEAARQNMHTIAVASASSTVQ